MCVCVCVCVCVFVRVRRGGGAWGEVRVHTSFGDSVDT